jgi:hypothetical protein
LPTGKTVESQGGKLCEQLHPGFLLFGLTANPNKSMKTSHLISLRLIWFSLALNGLLLASCQPAPQAVQAKPAKWQRLFKHPTVEVLLDTAHMQKQTDGSYLLVLRTLHPQTEVEQGRPFNRETVRLLLRCNPAINYKVVSVALAQDEGPDFYTQEGTVDVAQRTAWRAVLPKSADEGSFTTACSILEKAEK